MLEQEVLKLKKRLFLEAFAKHEGNMRAVMHVLGLSVRQAYKIRKLFTRDELAECLKTPHARRRSIIRVGFKGLKTK